MQIPQQEDRHVFRSFTESFISSSQPAEKECRVLRIENRSTFIIAPGKQFMNEQKSNGQQSDSISRGVSAWQSGPEIEILFSLQTEYAAVNAFLFLMIPENPKTLGRSKP